MSLFKRIVLREAGWDASLHPRDPGGRFGVGGDARRRAAERAARATGDPADAAEALRWKMRHGQVPRERIELAAALGHEAAGLVAPEGKEKKIDLAPEKDVRGVLNHLPDEDQIRVGVETAERVMSIIRPEHREVPQRAIDMTKKWLDDPTTKNFEAAWDAGQQCLNLRETGGFSTAEGHALSAVGHVGLATFDHNDRFHDDKDVAGDVFHALSDAWNAHVYHLDPAPKRDLASVERARAPEIAQQKATLAAALLEPDEYEP